jgi:hypothetical protein
MIIQHSTEDLDEGRNVEKVGEDTRGEGDD